VLENIDPKLILQSISNSLKDGGINMLNAPKPGTPEAGSLWQPENSPYPLIKNPLDFSKKIEQGVPGSTEKMWEMYQEHKKLPIDPVMKMIREHFK